MTVEIDHPSAKLRQAIWERKMVERRLAMINFSLTKHHDAALAGEAEALTVRLADLETKLKETLG